MGQAPNSHVHLEAMEASQDEVFQAQGVGSIGRTGVAMDKHAQGLLESI
jgi:hypothetical protein